MQDLFGVSLINGGEKIGNYFRIDAEKYSDSSFFLYPRVINLFFKYKNKQNTLLKVMNRIRINITRIFTSKKLMRVFK